MEIVPKLIIQGLKGQPVIGRPKVIIQGPNSRTIVARAAKPESSGKIYHSPEVAIYIIISQ